MEEKHLEEVLKIEHLVFSTPWQEKDFLFELNDNPVSFYYVYLIDEHVVGFIGSWINYDQGEITNVAVHPDYRKQGIGQALLAHALNKDIQSCTLEVRESNTAAIHLYEKNGFRKAAIRKNYYTKPDENGILMVKEDF